MKLQHDQEDELFDEIADFRRTQLEELSLDNAEPAMPSTSFDHCRVVLAHLGFLHLRAHAESGSSGRGQLRMLETGTRLERSLQLLDRNAPREWHKIGVIFVSENQAS
jgi:hypothetical protein